jgi:hypothetical protein
MEKQASTAEKLFDRAAQLWTTLEEDEQVQQWDQEEERVSAAIQELKKRKKAMSITEHMKGTQDMKKLQSELKTAQTKKQARQAELEPLQEKATQMITQLEEEKKNMAQAQTEGATLIQEEITTQSVEALTGKVHAGQGKRKGTHRQVPQPGRGCSGSTHYLGGSGRATCQCWGPVGHRPILRKYPILEGKAQFWRRTTGRKSNTCEEKPHAKEESMQGTGRKT